MEKILALSVPRESLHEEGVLEKFGESRVSDDFLVRRIEQNPTSVESSILVSASLFTTGPRVRLPATVTAEWFHQHIIKGPPEKYFAALCRRRSNHAESRMRLYISSNLEELIPWLFDLGFDEIAVMERQQADFMPGMLWRYLPIGESEYDWIVCTGVDHLGELGRELKVPHVNSSASLHPARFWMPFAGPFALRPAFLGGNVDIAAALSGFAEQWQTPRLDTYEGQILDRCRRGDRARYCDAAFLSLSFWKQSYLRAEPRLFLLGYSEFSKISIAPIRLIEADDED